MSLAGADNGTGIARCAPRSRPAAPTWRARPSTIADLQAAWPRSWPRASRSRCSGRRRRRDHPGHEQPEPCAGGQRRAGQRNQATRPSPTTPRSWPRPSASSGVERADPLAQRRSPFRRGGATPFPGGDLGAGPPAQGGEGGPAGEAPLGLLSSPQVTRRPGPNRRPRPPLRPGPLGRGRQPEPSRSARAPQPAAVLGGTRDYHEEFLTPGCVVGDPWGHGRHARHARRNVATPPRARAWLAANAPPAPRRKRRGAAAPDDVSVFHDLPEEQERQLLDRLMAWQRRSTARATGRSPGRPSRGAPAFPSTTSTLSSTRRRSTRPRPGTRRSVSPRNWSLPRSPCSGRPSSRTGSSGHCSGPSSCAASSSPSPAPARTSPGWLPAPCATATSGWSPGRRCGARGARFSAWGLLICRTDPEVRKHAGPLTAFMVPMDAPGIDVRPIRQMTGGASFNEVFLDGVRIADDLRLGAVGEGWKVTLVTLAFERAASGAHRDEGRGGAGSGCWGWPGTSGSPATRSPASGWPSSTPSTGSDRSLVPASAPQPAARARPARLDRQAPVDPVDEPGVGCRARHARAAARRRHGGVGDVRLARHVLGAPGYRIAGGSDEIQRTIIGERVLGLPARTPSRPRPPVLADPPMTPARSGQWAMAWPPSARRIEPVVKLEAELAR